MFRQFARNFGLVRKSVAPATAHRSFHAQSVARHAETITKADMLEKTAFSNQPVLKRTSLQFSLHHSHGQLLKALGVFHNHGINISQLKSREGRDTDEGRGITMYMDIEGHISDPHVKTALDELRSLSLFVTLVGSHIIPYFPRRIEDLDKLEQKALAAGADLESDHPGFHDKEYRKRRQIIADNAFAFRHGMEVPRVNYSPEEVSTWGFVYRRLQELFATHACREYQYYFPLLVENCGYREDNIPQLEDISSFLKEQTGFTIRPVAGLLSARDFLNCLAFRVFSSTQYIRHHSNPEYTPEPDVCHELLGHVPLFADKHFADFSQSIGLASLGASDDEIRRLATCYWFSVEFGLCKQNGDVRAYGAGLLSSFGELQYCKSGKPELREWNPFEACNQSYPITTFQPVYYVAENFESAKQKLEEFSASFSRPFRVEYNPYSQSVKTISENTERYMRNEQWN